MTLPSYLDHLAAHGFRGADVARPARIAGGYATAGDVLVNQTADGVDLNVVWERIMEAASVFNNERTTLSTLLSYRTTAAADVIPQSPAGARFEEASEFGVPTAARPSAEALVAGYDLKDMDLRLGLTWRAIRHMDQRQINHAVNTAMEADNRLVSGTILNQLMSPAEGLSPEGNRVFPLWNGDGTVPPAFGGRSWNGTETHYRTTGADTIDSADLELSIAAIRQKGYGRTTSSQILIIASPEDAEQISTFRAGRESRPGGPVSKFDFVASSVAPAFWTAEHVVGAAPPAAVSGIPCVGSFGGALVLPTTVMPIGWVAVVASNGPNSALNPVGVREHTNAAYRGFRVIPGNGPYPLVDSFCQRTFGTGIRHRGAAMALQITDDPTYTAPVFDV